MSNQMPPRDNQVGSSVRNELLSWGSRRVRSNPSLQYMLNNEGNQDETNRGPVVEPLLITEDKRIQSEMNAEAYHVSDNANENGESSMVNKASCLKLAVGDHNGRNPKLNVGNISSSGGKKLPSRHDLQVKSTNSESLSYKFISPCESIKVNPRKQHKQSDSYTPDEAIYQKAKLIKKGDAYDGGLKSGRTVASMEDDQNIPRKKDGSNYKVIDTSRWGIVHKEREKSWLPRISCAKQATKVVQVESSRQSDHANSGALIKVSLRTEVHAANIVEPKKRRRLVVSYAEVEEDDDEFMQVKDLDPRSCANSGKLKKQKRSMENSVKKQKRYAEVHAANIVERKKRRRHVVSYAEVEDDDDEFMQVKDLYPRSCVNNGKLKKQKRSLKNSAKNQKIYVEKSKGVLPIVIFNRRSSRNHEKLKKPLISEDISVRPIDKPYWTGIMKTGSGYIPLAAHLSSKAGKKVRELSRALPPVMNVMELYTLQASPKRLEAPKPRVDSVVLYFFSGDARKNKELDRLVKHVADKGVILETVVGFAKLFVFPSIVLPEEYQTYQGKHYLWGVFEHKDDKKKKKALPGYGTTSADMKALVPINMIPADHGQSCSSSED